MTKLVFGVGINDGSRPARFDDNSMTKEYRLWIAMLNRCYSATGRWANKTYEGCSVSVNFLDYAFFYDWCQNQIGFDKQDYQLDKDVIFVGNKVYSENTCVFIPRCINTFFTDRRRNRGSYPLGVDMHKNTGKYRARCSDGMGKSVNLGYFNTPQDAFDAYKPFKESLCKDLALKWKDEIDPRVYEAMMKWEVSITS